jgi:NAD(P)H-dependent FMN reductase
MKRVNLLAISGSLRKASYNSAALESMKELAPDSVSVNIYRGLGGIPLFNPDIENEVIPEVEILRGLIGKSDGVIISSPEYAHGISGVLKNCLDWLVSSEEFINIPVMLVNTSPRASHALDALREVIRTMSGQIIDSASISIPLLGTNLDSKGILKDKELSTQLKSGLYQFHSVIKNEI